jgi:hypothetical protein
MKSYPDKLEDFIKEVTDFILQKVTNILSDKNRYIKFDEEITITEGIIMGLSIDKNGEISIIINDEEIGEISFISMDFLSIDELTIIADELQGSRICLESLDSI